MLRNEHYFSDLDGLAGDGDFGTSLATGFKIIKADLPAIEKPDIGAMLLKLSMLMSKHVGGSSGPIWGTGFMKAGVIAKGKTEVTLEELAGDDRQLRSMASWRAAARSWATRPCSMR